MLNNAVITPLLCTEIDKKITVTFSEYVHIEEKRLLFS
jgi:hypothetical protein